MYAACTLRIPVHNIKASRFRTVPHGGFAAVQDDITSGALFRGTTNGSSDGRTTRPLYRLRGDGICSSMQG
jgi:hypothetical protein